MTWLLESLNFNDRRIRFFSVLSIPLFFELSLEIMQSRYHMCTCQINSNAMRLISAQCKILGNVMTFSWYALSLSLSLHLQMKRNKCCSALTDMTTLFELPFEEQCSITCKIHQRQFNRRTKTITKTILTRSCSFNTIVCLFCISQFGCIKL